MMLMPKIFKLSKKQLLALGAAVMVGALLMPTANAATVVIDVRTPQEWNDDHINDARVINIDVQTLSDNKDRLPKDKTLYVICRSGNRSGMAQIILTNFGFSVVNVRGGMNAW